MLTYIDIGVRLTQVIFGIISSALAGAARNTADGFFRGFVPSDYSATIDFFIFTGASAVVFAALRLLRYAIPSPRRRAEVIVELVFTSIWVIFWLAAISALPSRVNVFECYGLPASYCSNLRAAWAFGFLSFLLWIVSLVLLVLEVINGGSYSSSRSNVQLATPTAAKPAAQPGV